MHCCVLRTSISSTTIKQAGTANPKARQHCVGYSPHSHRERESWHLSGVNHQHGLGVLDVLDVSMAGKSGFMRRTHTRTRGACRLVWRGREIIGMPPTRRHPCKNKRLALVRVIRCAACYCSPCAVRCGLSLTKGVLHCKGLRNVTVPLATTSPSPSKSSHALTIPLTPSQ